MFTGADGFTKEFLKVFWTDLKDVVTASLIGDQKAELTLKPRFFLIVIPKKNRYFIN